MPQGDSKLVKKEELEDEEFKKSIASTVANRKKESPSSNATLKSEPKVKKEVKNGEIKKKTKKEVVEMEEEKKEKGGNAGDTDKDTKKREKKVFDLPGQKRDPHEERDPLRILNETLYKQVPTSDMASLWMMESGLLPKEEAKKVSEKKQKWAQQQKLGTPTRRKQNPLQTHSCEEVSRIPRFSTEEKDV